jgi:hypothetical protein
MPATTAPTTDFHQWTLDTAQALAERRFEDVDWELVIEELRGLAASERNELKSHLAQLMYHMLKIQYQPERHGRSWDLSVRNHREEVLDLIERQPSLKPLLRNKRFMSRAYGEALGESGKENLPDSVATRFPDVCPFTLAVLLPELE